jgi:cation transport protein ChaC
MSLPAPYLPALPVPEMTFTPPRPVRDPAPMLERTLAQWGGRRPLWIFGYASLIWRPDFDVAERRMARVLGWHRALRMWSRVNRGTPDFPGLVFALLSGGSCQGAVLRVAPHEGEAVLRLLWQREMPSGVYDPRWLHCRTDKGPVHALAFTLSRRSPNFTGELAPERYAEIFRQARGRYGTTLEYACQTLDCLDRHGIPDTALRRLLAPHLPKP